MIVDVVEKPAKRPGDEQHYTQCPKRLLILGWNEAIDEVIVEYDSHAIGHGEVHILCSEAEIERIELDTSLLKNTTVQYYKGDTWRRAPLVAVDPGSFDVILVLAESEQADSNTDAVTILTLLLLRDILGDNPKPKIICDINNDDNRELILPGLADDLIVSPEVISIQLARISEEPLLGIVNRELSSAGGVELALHPIRDYGFSDDEVVYSQILAAALAYHETAIGILDTSIGGKVNMYPAPDTIYPQQGDFKVIVLAHQIFT
jgi:hypothetical protein